MNLNRGKYKKQLMQNAIKVYEYIQNNPGCTASQIQKSLGIKHISRVSDLISSLDNHEGYLVSENNNRYYIFDRNKLDNQFWITQ